MMSNSRLDEKNHGVLASQTSASEEFKSELHSSEQKSSESAPLENKQIIQPRSDIDEVVYFLYVNADFFAAPFIDGIQFQEWAKKIQLEYELTDYADDYELSEYMEDLSDDMKEVLVRENAITLIDFSNAICGKALQNDNKKNSLLSGNINRTVDFINRNPLVTEMFKKHLKNPVIDKWYKDKATEFQKNRRLQRLSDKLEYQKKLEKYTEYQKQLAKSQKHENEIWKQQQIVLQENLRRYPYTIVEPSPKLLTKLLKIKNRIEKKKPAIASSDAQQPKSQLEAQNSGRPILSDLNSTPAPPNPEAKQIIKNKASHTKSQLRKKQIEVLKQWNEINKSKITSEELDESSPNPEAKLIIKNKASHTKSQVRKKQMEVWKQWNEKYKSKITSEELDESSPNPEAKLIIENNTSPPKLRKVLTVFSAINGAASGTTVGWYVGLLLAPLTGGLSLVAGPIVGGFIGAGVGGYLGWKYSNKRTNIPREAAAGGASMGATIGWWLYIGLHLAPYTLGVSLITAALTSVACLLLGGGIGYLRGKKAVDRDTSSLSFSKEDPSRLHRSKKNKRENKDTQSKQPSSRLDQIPKPTPDSEIDNRPENNNAKPRLEPSASSTTLDTCLPRLLHRRSQKKPVSHNEQKGTLPNQQPGLDKKPKKNIKPKKLITLGLEPRYVVETVNEETIPALGKIIKERYDLIPKHSFMHRQYSPPDTYEVTFLEERSRGVLKTEKNIASQQQELQDATPHLLNKLFFS